MNKINQPCTIQEVYERLNTKLNNYDLELSSEDIEFIRMKMERIKPYLNNSTFCQTI
jgi:hypothetical protein